MRKSHVKSGLVFIKGLSRPLSPKYEGVFDVQRYHYWQQVTPCTISLGHYKQFEKTAVLLVSVQEWVLGRSDICHIFTQSVKLYTFWYHPLRVKMFEWLLLSAKIYDKILVSFCLNTGKRFLLEVSF